VLEVHRVHLVDGHDDRANTHQRAHREVTVRLRADAAGGVDQQDRDVRRGGGHRHVAGVLLVAGRVGDDRPAAGRQVEVPVGDVDGDALLVLGLEAVGEHRVVDLPLGDGRAAAAGVAGVVEDVVGDALGLGEQPADQRRLAVVDRPAGDDPDDRVLGERGVVEALGGGAGHQKYPSVFLLSIEPPPSPSMSRPDRSERRSTSISSSRSSRLSAVDSTAAVSG
jgi:hypothetical protein